MNTNALFKIGYGLYVLSAHKDGKDNGCIINAVSQITNTPNRVMVCINKQNYTHDMILDTGLCNISVLSEQVTFDTFKHFGFQSGRDVNKFENYPYAKRAENGVMYVTDKTNAYLSLKVEQKLDLDTHTMFICTLDAAEILSDVPTTSYDYYQKNIKPRPEQTQKKGYRCKICGYIHESDVLPEDFICPLCKHPASDFEKIV